MPFPLSDRKPKSRASQHKRISPPTSVQSIFSPADPPVPLQSRALMDGCHNGRGQCHRGVKPLLAPSSIFVIQFRIQTEVDDRVNDFREPTIQMYLIVGLISGRFRLILTGLHAVTWSLSQADLPTRRTGLSAKRVLCFSPLCKLDQKHQYPLLL